jgi:hypothetical protein
MKQRSAMFLQAIIILLAVGVFALLLWEPRIEGVNAHATNFKIYADPFVLLVYIGSVPFFAALFQAFKVLGYARHNTVFSKEAVNALRTIKYYALAIIGFVVAEEIFILLNHGSDDATGGIAMGILITFGCVLIATAAAMFERILQTAVDLKSENDLTV